MNASISNTAQVSANSAAVAAFAILAGGRAVESFTSTAAHIGCNTMGVMSIRGFVGKRDERDSWTSMSSCGNAEVSG